MASAIQVNGDIGQRRQLGLSAQRELAHILRRQNGLISAYELVVLAKAGGLSDTEIRKLVLSWVERRWPRR